MEPGLTEIIERKTKKIAKLRAHFARNPHDFRARMSLERSVNRRAKHNRNNQQKGAKSES